MSNRNAFLVFEGGGAKAIAHIGSLAAVESTSEIEIIGAAGTSAGSIIAALVAAGYSSEELLQTSRSAAQDGRVSSVFDFADAQTNEPKDLFKRKHWLLLKLVRWFVQRKDRNIFGRIGRTALGVSALALFLFPAVSHYTSLRLCPIVDQGYVCRLADMAWLASTAMFAVVFLFSHLSFLGLMGWFL